MLTSSGSCQKPKAARLFAAVPDADVFVHQRPVRSEQLQLCLAPGRHGSKVCVTRAADLLVASLSLRFRRCRHYAKHTRSVLRGAPIVRPRHRLPSGLFTRFPRRRSWHPVSFDSSHRPATNNQKRRTRAASGHGYWRKEEEPHSS